MTKETMMTCVVSALNNLMEKDEGIIVSVEGRKYIVMRSENTEEHEINISEITEDDGEFFQDLKEGEIVFFED